MLGDNSDGFANEIEIIDYLNKTRLFDNLNNNFKVFLEFLFNENLTGKTIFSYKPEKQVKPDIAIIINNNTKYVSVKKGSGNSVHQEKLKEFEKFLDNCNISKKIIEYLKEFHYGDGSIDGTGKLRIKATQWQKENFEKIKMINSSFNTQNMLRKFFDRFLFVGNIPGAPIVDVIYHGNIEKGLWANKTEIINYLLNNPVSSTTVHFSNLTYQVWNRNLKFNPNTEDRRHIMQVKWTSITKDFINITKNRG